MGLQGLFHRSIFCIKQFVQFVAQFIAAAVANEGGYDIAIAVEQYFGRESGDAELLNGQLFSIGENIISMPHNVPYDQTHYLFHLSGPKLMYP
jgi:hypothetical protein